MTGTIREKLNPIYQRLFGSAVFDRPAVEEPRATCDNCAMCDHGQLAPVEMGYFKPELKCCTWHPRLANFLVGAILSNTDPALEEGRRRLRAKIAARQGVSAIGITAPAKYKVLQQATVNAFGRAPSLLCPYYSHDGGGTCTVWQYRDSVCSTYFCKFQDGKPGYQFWLSMKEYVSFVEGALAILSAQAVDRTLPQPLADATQLTLEDLEDLPPTEQLYSSLWGKWVGREEEFYLACYRYVAEMSPREFTEKLDRNQMGIARIAELEKRLDVIEHRTVLPERLVRAANLKTRPAGENVVVTSYNAYDAFAVDRELFDVLAKLDGAQPLAENLKRLDEQEGIELEPDLLQFLFTHGVVEEAPPPPATNVTIPKERNKEKALRRKRR